MDTRKCIYIDLIDEIVVLETGRNDSKLQHRAFDFDISLSAATAVLDKHLINLSHFL